MMRIARVLLASAALAGRGPRKPILATNGEVTSMASREFQNLNWQVVRLK
jgi:hypothetical protein